ncbi:hypothetical protein BXZ70DRAFT_890869, partial [Cristinia sonorae]
MNPKKGRSSLEDHSFPAFYACYLLKSVRTPRSSATYIGSTPNPPRRLRQHNGEISQGAWKTKHNRPWAMQMIVHGFPSKLAALQFEWAWQHPHISRHLRDDHGKAVFSRSRAAGSRRMKNNVQVARTMITSSPYNTWPLHVKLFTEEAQKAWQEAARGVPDAALPPGFTYTLELEGVDGKSGQSGSGRTGPLVVTDEHFTNAHLKKADKLSTTLLKCSICHESITDFKKNHVAFSLCPAGNCNSVSHLTCLATQFLSSPSSSNSTSLIPRGGECVSCHTYVLWGDIVRGCYRRHKGGAVVDTEPESDGEEDSDSQDL